MKEWWDCLLCLTTILNFAKTKLFLKLVVIRLRCLINIMSSQERNSKRVKYDSQLLLKYAFDYKTENTAGVPNIINICRVKVKKTGGAVLAHYYAQIYLSNNFNFEFHPGSQPKTFQSINDNKDYLLFKSLLLCEKCCRKEIEAYVEGENGFNIAFQNCETILCKRKSVQTVIGTVLLIVLLINIINFTVINLIFIAFLVFLLFIVNNYMLLEPRVEYCKHYVRDGQIKLEHGNKYD
ncbi:unknown [Choristoneura occidentalis granulovirus]|uniref:Ac81-like protein n=1 Tax=Choristoneura occidentalis granulovirus TaxID=364745 RepID=Q1A4L4_9BBAC|nr:unknown [Choristoneura fumiferana granulovirus]ABC61216.1 unknown [Choristoneura fumiferana granulovirus]